MMQQPEVRSDADLAVRVLHGDLKGLDKLAPDALAVFCFSDVRPLCGAAGFVDWRCCGALSRALESGAFAGQSGEVMMLPVFGRSQRRRIFAFGLGESRQADRRSLRQAIAQAARVMQAAGVHDLVLAAPASHGSGSWENEFVRAASEEVPGVAQVLVGQ